MDLLDCHAVDLGFGLGQAGEDLPGSVFLPLSQAARRRSWREYAADGDVRCSGGYITSTFVGPKSLALDLLGHQAAAGQAQGADDLR